MDVWVSKHDFKPYSGSVDVIVPVTYEIAPGTIPVNAVTPVVVTVWDSGGAPLPDVEITIDGWGIAPEVDVTDVAGEAHFSLMPPFGEDLTVVGSELSQTYNAFEDLLPVTGGSLQEKEAECPECGSTHLKSLPSWAPLGFVLYEGPPVWEYQCQQCQNVFRLPVPGSPSQEKEIKCPACGGGHIHRLTSTGVQPLYCG